MSRLRKNVRPEGATVAIFVEGGDDQKMVERLAPANPALWLIRLDGSDAETSRRQAQAAAKDPGWPHIRTVGVVLDASEAPAESEIRCQELLALTGSPVPTESNTVVEQGGRRGGYAVVPHDAPGGSETLLLRTLDDQLRQCVDDFFACVGEMATTIEQRDKARAWAAAATQPDPRGKKVPCRPDMLWPGVDLGHPAVQPLRDFLAKLVAP